MKKTARVIALMLVALFMVSMVPITASATAVYERVYTDMTELSNGTKIVLGSPGGYRWWGWNPQNNTWIYDRELTPEMELTLLIENDSEDKYKLQRSDGMYLHHDDYQDGKANVTWVEEYDKSSNFVIKRSTEFQSTGAKRNYYTLWAGDYGLVGWSGEGYVNYEKNVASYYALLVRSAYVVTYDDTYGNSFTQTVTLPNSTDYPQHTFIASDLDASKCPAGKKLDHWVRSWNGAKYYPGESYPITENMTLTAVYHTHSYSTTTVPASGNTVGYTKHTCSCGDVYLDAFAQETGVKNATVESGKLKITYTDGTTDDLGSVAGAAGDDGREVELQASATHIQWRYKGDANWTDLIALSAITGPKGDKGDVGEKGEKGDKGDKGDVGEKGEKGDKGDTGATGATGADGKDGKDGKDGVDGKAGTNGIDGKDGVNGKDGAAGADGKDGKDGLNGNNGKDGLTPCIGENGNWWIGEADTGVKALVGESEIVSATINDAGELVVVLADGSIFRAVSADAVAQANAGVSNGSGDSLDAIAIAAFIMSAAALLWNAIALAVKLLRKKKSAA